MGIQYWVDAMIQDTELQIVSGTGSTAPAGPEGVPGVCGGAQVQVRSGDREAGVAPHPGW